MTDHTQGQRLTDAERFAEALHGAMWSINATPGLPVGGVHKHTTDPEEYEAQREFIRRSVRYAESVTGLAARCPGEGPTDADDRETLARTLAAEEWPDLSWEHVWHHCSVERFYRRADAVLAAGFRREGPTDNGLRAAVEDALEGCWCDQLLPTQVPCQPCRVHAVLAEHAPTEAES